MATTKSTALWSSYDPSTDSITIERAKCVSCFRIYPILETDDAERTCCPECGHSDRFYVQPLTLAFNTGSYGI